MISDSVELFKSSLSLKVGDAADYRPGDDACILAAMALVHLSHLERSNGNEVTADCHLLQATALLTFLNRRAAPNYQASLILVRLHILLGNAFMAIETYNHLAIKHIQVDALSHNLFTRISSINPCLHKKTSQPLIEQDDLTPRSGLERCLKLYERSKGQIPRMTKLAVEQGSYGQVPSFVELAAKLDNSISKFMWTIELLRVLRHCTVTGSPEAPAVNLTGAGKVNFVSIMISWSPLIIFLGMLPSMTDQRDDEVVPNYESSTKPSFETCIRVGPKPGVRLTYQGNLVIDGPQLTRILASMG